MKIFSPLLLLFISVSVSAQATYTSTGASSDWSSTLAWSVSGTDGDGDGLPDSNDDVVIAPGTTIVISSGNRACQNLSLDDTDGSTCILVVNSGTSLAVNGNLSMHISIEEGSSTINAQGTITVTGTFTALADEPYGLVNLTVGSSGAMDINGTGVSSYKLRDTESTATFTNNGSFTCAGDFELIGSGDANTRCTNNASGTFQVDGDLRIISEGSFARSTFRNRGTLNVDTDLEFNANSSALASNTTLDLKFSDNNVNLAGNIVMLNNGGNVSSSATRVSNFTYDGSGQTVSGNDNVFYYNLIVAGSNSPVLGSNIEAGHIINDFEVSSGSTFSLEENEMHVDSIVDIDGTLNVDGVLHVGDDLILNSGGSIAASDSLYVTGDVSINGTWTSTGSHVSVLGNWTNSNNGYTGNTGDVVTFEGTTGTSTISGTTNFRNITIDHAGTGVENTGTVNVYEILDIDNGTYTTGSNTIIISDANGTGGIYDLTGGDISGTVRVQRRVAMTAEGWCEIVAPVQGALLTQWMNNGVITSGFTNSNYPNFPFVSVVTYDENTANGEKDSGYVDANDALTHSITAFNASRVYLAAQTFNISVSGEIFKNTQTFNIDYEDDTPDADEKGWNYIGNPYPCTVDWDNLTAGDRTNIENEIYTWSAAAGNYGIYVGGAGSGTNGVSQYIASSQGFWVHATATGASLTLNEDDKSTQDPTFVKTAFKQPTFSISVTSDVNSYSDEVLLTTNPNATDGYEGLDAPKMFAPENFRDRTPSMYFVADAKAVSYNVIKGKGAHQLPLQFEAGTEAHGNYTLHFGELENFMTGHCLFLEDRATGAMIDVRNNASYTFNSNQVVNGSRFVVHISPNESGLCFRDDLQEAAAQKALDNEEQVNLFANRSTVHVNYILEENQTVTVRVFDVAGREVTSKQMHNTKEGTLQLPVPSAKNGVYIVKVRYGYKTKTQRLLLQP